MALRPVTLLEALYKGVQVVLEKFGDFLREVAALVLVFIPLDLWKGDFTWQRSIGIILVSLAIFTFGLVSELGAVAVKRARDLYEEEQERGSGTSAKAAG